MLPEAVAILIHIAEAVYLHLKTIVRILRVLDRGVALTPPAIARQPHKALVAQPQDAQAAHLDLIHLAVLEAQAAVIDRTHLEVIQDHILEEAEAALLDHRAEALAALDVDNYLFSKKNSKKNSI